MLLDLYRLHNSSPPETNVFLRYHEGGEYEQSSTGNGPSPSIGCSCRAAWHGPRARQ